eukprot:CAMPEP_0198109826 /NCGR_PEP_ID=MMETSP1442-20131203/1868_1 /TAXON_ID= /ORGANISM="Craspedostauros australis, Strain CCMP3328" /LENGTH=188 /DNA_ID=CAMNT_0043765637 /DNA_START=107 /DNA_END=669 /DNA_ORIENTATION=+
MSEHILLTFSCHSHCCILQHQAVVLIGEYHRIYHGILCEIFVGQLRFKNKLESPEAELVGHKDQLLQIILSSEDGSWLVRDIYIVVSIGMSADVSNSVVTSAVIRGYLGCADALDDVSDVFWLKVGERNGYLHGAAAVFGAIIRMLMLDSFVDQCLHRWDGDHEDFGICLDWFLLVALSTQEDGVCPV